MIILGVDPGIATVGYGVVSYENNKFIDSTYGAILTPANSPRYATSLQGLSSIIR